MGPKIAIAFYSTWGHVRQLVCRESSFSPRGLLANTLPQAEAEKKGIEEAGGTATLFQSVSPSPSHPSLPN